MKSTRELMREEWNAIAKRNAYWGVLSDSEFKDPGQIDQEAFWETGRRDVDLFLERLPLGNTRTWTMVEIGCGLGRMTSAFARRFGRVHAIDVSPEMIERAREQWGELDNVRFVLGNGDDVPGVDDASVDFAFSYIVLQHIPDPEIVKTYIREVARVLAPGRFAYLQLRTDVDAYATRSLAQRARGSLAHPLRGATRVLKRLLRDPFFPHRVPIEQDFGRYDSWKGCALAPEEVRRLTESLGLRIERVENERTKYSFYTLRKS